MITVGDIKKLIKDFPDHYEVVLNSPEMDSDPFELMASVNEGDTSDGPGSISLTVMDMSGT